MNATTTKFLSSRPPGANLPLVPLAAVLAILGTLFTWRAWLFLSTDNSANCYVWMVLAAMVVLAWSRRGQMALLDGRGQWIGLFLVIVGLLGIFAGSSWLLDWMACLGAVCVVVGAIAAISGYRLFSRFWALLLLAGLLVPVPPLAWMSFSTHWAELLAEGAHWLLTRSNIESEPWGGFLLLNGSVLSMTDCYGSLPGLVLAALAGYVFLLALPFKWFIRLILALPVAAVVMLLVAVRIWLALMCYAHVSGAAAQSEAFWLGWGICPFVFIVLAGIFRLLARMGVPVFRKQPVAAEPVLVASAHTKRSFLF